MFQRTCAPPDEELPVDSCFDKSDGEAVGYEPVQLDAGDVGTIGPGGDTDPLQGVVFLIVIAHSCSRSVVCVAGRARTVARV